MNMASALHWIPDSLYNAAISVIVENYRSYQKELRTFHEAILFDVYYRLYKAGRLCQLAFEFSNLDIFYRLLKVRNKRNLLHICFQAVMDHGARSASELAEAYRRQCALVCNSTKQIKQNVIRQGFFLGGFLCDAGWFPESEKVVMNCLELCKTLEAPELWPLCLECHLRLLRVRNLYCKFEEAIETYNEARQCISKITENKLNVNFSGIFGEFSALFSAQSNYKGAYYWSLEALMQLNSCLPAKVIIDVLRQAAKACVVKREFQRARMLIQQAIHAAKKDQTGNGNPVLAETLIDYGFYLLNVDSVGHSIKVYQNALDMRVGIFGGRNLLVATAHEELAYASYVYEYSTGQFKDAKEHAEKAMDIMHGLLPEDHFLLASSKRVKALILEEIAIDAHDKILEKQLLSEAQELHTCALKLAQKAFGEKNVQTAKHYGNLGRLYQSMNKFEEAQEMHLKAIAIKEEILGPDDYEVALSLGHLASLYNYDMKLYDQAKELYMRSITIGRKLFGDGYSGLEYDYRGLLKVYTSLGDNENAIRLHGVLHNWKTLRDKNLEMEKDTSPLALHSVPIAPEEIYTHFNSIN